MSASSSDFSLPTLSASLSMIQMAVASCLHAVSYTHLTLPTKQVV